MKLMGLSALAVAAIAVGAAISFAHGSDPEALETQNLKPGSMGPVCWAAIVEVAYQTSSRCDFGEDGVREGTLEAYSKAREALGEKFLASGWTEEALAEFRATQGNADVPTQDLCGFDRDDDTGRFLISLAKTNPSEIEATTSKMLAVQGRPVWGTCL